MAEELTLTCSACGASRKTKATPAGRPRVVPPWKELGGRLYCGACKRQAFVLRACELPVFAPLTRDGAGAGWPELREALSAAWGLSTSLANWSVQELMKADFVRMPSMAGCPKLPDLKALWGPSLLYGRMNQAYPDRAAWAGMKGSAASLCRQLLQNYVGNRRFSRRYRILWLGQMRWATYDYPHPFPVRSQEWAASWLGGRPQEPVSPEGAWGVPVVSLPLAGATWRLRLASGPGFLRQLRDFAAVVGGAAAPAELQLYRRVDHQGGANDRRNGRTGPGAAAPGGGAGFQTTVFCKLVGYFPAAPRHDRERAMSVRTAGRLGEDGEGGGLLVATVGGRAEPFRLAFAHVPRWVMAHRRRTRAAADDMKAEKRLPAWKKRQLLDRMKDWSRDYDDKLDSSVKEAAEQLIGFARRQRVASITYDDTDRSFCDYRWHALHGRVKLLAEQAGIEFVRVGRFASGEAPDESAGAARVEINP